MKVNDDLCDNYIIKTCKTIDMLRKGKLSADKTRYLQCCPTFPEGSRGELGDLRQVWQTNRTLPPVKTNRQINSLRMIDLTIIIIIISNTSNAESAEVCFNDVICTMWLSAKSWTVLMTGRNVGASK